ncbi:MAG: hypothetical protein QW548_02505 [Candidatus Aenigmatarchaeota archaeon]
MAPAEAIAVAKKKASYGDALGTLVVDGIVLAVAAAILFTVGGSFAGLGAMLGQGVGLAVVSVFAAVLVGGLFFALLAKIVACTLGGKGGYLEALTVCAYSLGAPAVSLLVVAIFASMQYVGLLIGFIALSLGIALGVSTLYRSIKELFSTDMVTALVAVGILTMVVFTAFAVMMPMAGMSTAGLALRA